MRIWLILTFVIPILCACTVNDYENGKDGSVDKLEQISKEDESAQGGSNNPGKHKDQKTKPHKLHVKVSPTFHLEPQAGNTYDASNLIDNNLNTAWAISLDKGGIDADVIDWLEFDIDSKRISHIIITNGYAKSENSYKNNARGKTVLISRVSWEEAEDEDILYYGELKDTMQPQKLVVSDKYNNSKPTRKVYVMFESDVYKGAKYNGFCISEIEFYGY